MARAEDSDARLTELLRADSATAYEALQELRARHRPAVLKYARLCATSDSAARQLAAQVFTLAARETARGIDPGGPWRHRLLLLTGRLAASWATDERAAGLDAGLLLVLNTAGPAGPVPPMLGAFQSLPARVQGVLWYAVVEREPDDRTAALLGLTRADVTYATGAALQQLGRACLRARLAASDDPDCRDFHRLIEESVRPDSPRGSADLHAHMARCATCTAAYEELSALRDDPRRTLGEGLLPWAGTAYVMDNPSPVAHNPAAETAHWPRSRRFALVSAALGVALAPVLVFLVTQGGSAEDGQDPVSAVSSPTSAPPVTVTATVSAPAPSPSATSKSPSPTPTRSSAPPPSRTPGAAPTASLRPPGASYARVVNVSSGLCLDVRDAVFEKGTDVITAPCTSSRTQVWRVDSERGVVQSSADPEFCLDSRGSVERGVGIWECDSVHGSNGQNLRFAVDSRGVIRPGIAPGHAVTPVGGGAVALVAESGGAGQRWRAG
ncbi:ricin-type beta-trefoil lectin domain protein [Streptomyces sp. P17]|uniref:ricin-type beta-trefoil lectin domain protein n=1 Tax=Streptomyces sp. P17 TaxID=3074716 RepID=UPI0028F44930|nr:ricin-type beta-trefoil lectin domain protein [Streptomyces sp. P17]MDT9701109.1 ricin-type beta-trefoil lectin domain protein [Streptomyces sp. P17]